MLDALLNTLAVLADDAKKLEAENPGGHFTIGRGAIQTAVHYFELALAAQNAANPKTEPPKPSAPPASMETKVEAVAKVLGMTGEPSQPQAPSEPPA